MLVKKQQLEPDLTTNWFKIGKRVHHGCILSPCLFNLFKDYIMQTSRLDESQTGINTARRNISNLRYADGTTLMAGSKEELKSLLIKVKEGIEKTDLKLNIQKTKIMASRPITSWQIGDNGNSEKLYFLGLQNHCSHEMKRCSLLGRKAMSNLDNMLKNRDTTLTTKVHLVKAMVFPVVTLGGRTAPGKARSGRRFLGTNGATLWLWSCLPKPGAPGP